MARIYPRDKGAGNLEKKYDYNIYFGLSVLGTLRFYAKLLRSVTQNVGSGNPTATGPLRF